LERRAKQLGISRIVTFGADEKSDARLIDVALHAACSAVHANILGHDVTYKVGMPGRHMAMNSLAVLAAASLAGADLALASLALSHIEPAAGRGVRRVLEMAVGEATLIDESYNANPASMSAALGVLGQARIGPHGRRIAVLGDMLELGASSAELHRGLNDAIKAHHIDLVYCCGPQMKNLWDALSTGKRGGYADSAANLEPQIVAAIRAGDAIMVKGSFGSKMKTIVNALERRFPGRTALDEAAVSGRLNVLLADRSLQYRAWPRLLAHLPERVSLHHVPHRRSDGDRRAFRVPVRPLDHRSLAASPGQGTADPLRRPAVASGDQEGHSDHGRPDDPFGARGFNRAVGQSTQPLCLDRAGGHARLRLRRFL